MNGATEGWQGRGAPGARERHKPRRNAGVSPLRPAMELRGFGRDDAIFYKQATRTSRPRVRAGHVYKQATRTSGPRVRAGHVYERAARTGRFAHRAGTLRGGQADWAALTAEAQAHWKL